MTAPDFSHLNALQFRLHNEARALAAATSASERELRAVWVAQIEREIAAEYAFLGITPCTASDAELLAHLDKI